MSDPWSELARQQRLYKALDARLRQAGKRPASVDKLQLGRDLLPLVSPDAGDLRDHAAGFKFSIRHVTFTVAFIGGRHGVVISYRHAEALSQRGLAYDKRQRDRVGAIVAGIRSVMAGKVTPFDTDGPTNPASGE
ncbi:MAG: hypothetical protein ACKOCB_03135 [Planctomycetia bacterium]